MKEDQQEVRWVSWQDLGYDSEEFGGRVWLPHANVSGNLV